MRGVLLLGQPPDTVGRRSRAVDAQPAFGGLLGYPLLQTVDIAIVHGTLVPVGEDQVAHLELSREIVEPDMGLLDAAVDDVNAGCRHGFDLQSGAAA